MLVPAGEGCAAERRACGNPYSLVTALQSSSGVGIPNEQPTDMKVRGLRALGRENSVPRQYGWSLEQGAGPEASLRLVQK